jgi:hypothetical protein
VEEEVLQLLLVKVEQEVVVVHSLFMISLTMLYHKVLLQ